MTPGSKRICSTWNNPENAYRRVTQQTGDLQTLRYRFALMVAMTVDAQGKPKVIVDVVDLKHVAPEFKRVTESLDKTAIRDALTKGEQLEFARLGNPTPTLTIRRG